MECPDASPKRSVNWLLCVALALPLLYLLSIGPAFRIYEDCGPRGRDAILMIYTPLEQATRPFPVVRDVLEKYVELFV